MRLNHLKILLPYGLAVFGLAILTWGMHALGNHINPITVALVFLLFVFFTATVFGSKAGLFASIEDGANGSRFAFDLPLKFNE